MNAGATAATAADDAFHRPASDDPFWTETAWFGFSVPERRLAGAVYPVFRPNQGICSSGLYVWDDRAESAHDILYARNWWHLPMPKDLERLELPSGLSYEQLEPLQRYRIRYDDGGECTLDLVFDALHAPHAPMLGPAGHLDQAGHVTGTLVLSGEEIEVDCYEMRDRSWSVRNDTGIVRAGYDYGLGGPGHGFLAMSLGAGDIPCPVVSGFHLHDGTAVPLTGGTRTVERVDGRPAVVHIDATDEAGCTVVAEGTCRNRFAFQSSPNYFAWMSLTEWRLDGATAFGQDQDVWSPDQWRAFRRNGT